MSDKKECKVELILEDEKHEFTMGYEGETITEVAQKHGIDVPFSCQSGVCRTCLAVVKEGEVEMSENFVLEDDEIENGYILSCQGHPKTPNITIDFDDV